MRLVVRVMAVAAALFSPGRGLADAPPNDSPFGGFTWSVAGGPSVPVVDSSKRFPAGGQFALTFGYYLFPGVMVQAEYLYSDYGITGPVHPDIHRAPVFLSAVALAVPDLVALIREHVGSRGDVSLPAPGFRVPPRAR